MNKEELLAEAKRRFPIGCKFKCVAGNERFKERIPLITKDIIFHIMENDGSGQAGVYTSNSLWLFMHGKWAKIVNKRINIPNLIE